MSAKDKSNKNAKTAPYQHPLWNALGWVFCYFVAACVGLVLFYVFRGDISDLFSTKDSLWTIENFIKVAIGIFALFAFVVTIWRGNLHAQQVSGQMEQLKLGREQLEKTEDNNIAKLLIDGTKLLADGSTEAEKMAGIACLANIINGKNGFIKQAVDVLKSSVLTYSKANQEGINMQEVKDPWFFYAMDTLQDYAFHSKQEISVFGVVLRGTVRTTKGIRWPNLSEIQYKDVRFHVVDFAGVAQFYIEGCYIMDSYIDDGCRFETIRSKIFSSYGLIGNNVQPSHFIACVFRNITSSSYPVHGVMLNNFKHEFTGCFYDDSEVAGIGKIEFFEKHGITRLSTSSFSSLCRNKKSIR